MKEDIIENGSGVYSLLSSVVDSDDLGAVIVYGISIAGKDGYACERDISDDYSFVRELFELVADGELAPEHLADVVEDSLSAA